MKIDSRAYTADEMRTMFLDKLSNYVTYWAETDLGLPAMSEEVRKVVQGNIARKGEIRYRLEGLVHSILVVLDGLTDLPAFNISANPCPGDEAWFKAEGKNWWPAGTAITDDDEMLHDEWNTGCANLDSLK
jgi:hypothetical protein